MTHHNFLPERKLSGADAEDDWKNDESVNAETDQNGGEVKTQLLKFIVFLTLSNHFFGIHFL